MPDYTGQEHVIVGQAQLLPSSERAAYLDRACGVDTGLRQRVEALLADADKKADAVAATKTPKTPTTIDSDDLPDDMPQLAVPGMRIGRYKLIEELGAGGCGVVFRAEQIEPVRRTVALKVIRLGMDTEEVIARFDLERQALALMDHPNIAKVLDAGATPTGRPFFVMELVDGPKLTDYCDEKKLTLEQRLELFLPVCNALQHAHQKGIIHRDIKPSNILVSMQDGVPVPKVIDFGIAKATEGKLTDQTLYTALDQFFGTPAYMSPEQAGLGGLDIDTRSDIYSLGVLLYELLTGETPLDPRVLADAGVDEVRRMVREEEPPRPSARVADLERQELSTIAGQRSTEPSKLVSGLRGDLDWIVMKCLEKDRQRRYDSASALALDIQRHLHHEPVTAGPPSTLYILGKFARRHRAVLATATTFVVLLVIATAVSLWQAGLAQRAATDANAQKKIAEEQTLEAQKQRHEVQLAYNRMDVAKAINEIEDNDPNEAVAYLTRALRAAPDNRDAASLLYSILSQENWLLPLSFVENQSAVFALDPAGRHIASAGTDNFIHLLDIATGKQISTITTDGPIGSIEFSANGARMLIQRGGGPGFGRGTTPQRRGNNPSDRGGPPAGRNGRGGGRGGLLNGRNGRGGGRGAFPGTGRGPQNFGGPISVFDVATGKQVSTAAIAVNEGVVAVHLNADGQKVIVATANGVEIRDATTGQVISPAIPFAAPASVTAAQLSPDGARLAVATRTGDPALPGDIFSIGMWDVASKSPVFATIAVEQPVKTIEFSPDGSKFVAAVGDTVHVWDATSGQAAIEPIHHEGDVYAVSFSPDGRRIITGSADETARIWSAVTGQPVSASLRGDGAMLAAIFAPDGQNIFTATSGLVQTWAFSPDVKLATTSSLNASFQELAFSADGWRFTAAVQGNLVRVWDSVSLKPLTQPLPLGARGGLRLSADGRLLALPVDNRSLRIWDIAKGEALSPAIALDSPWRSAKFSDDGKRIAIATVSANNSVRVWDTATGQPVSQPLLNNNSQIRAMAFSPDAQTLYTAASDRSLRAWDIATGESSALALRLESLTPEPAPVFSPDAQHLLVANGNSARIWNVESGKPESAPMQMDANITSVHFSPDGELALTESRAQSMRLWDANSGEFVSLPIHMQFQTDAIFFGPDGQSILDLATNGTLRTLPIPTDAGPPWILDLAETLAQCRIDETGTAIYDRGKPLDTFRSDAAQATTSANPLVEWAREVMKPNP